MKKLAALYLRSSKDRSDVSIDVQRRELQTLATERDIRIAAEFSDVVESGKDDNRPGFQQLYAELRSSKREWNTILLLDTSRLSRRRVNAVVFEEIECKRRGVELIYKSLPETDPITEMLLKSILQAMDEWHSLNSRQKGLSGMAENVRQGYRAGGRAPIGYQLKRIETGAVRDGNPVTKSVLEPSERAPAVGRYLKHRADGMARTKAARLANLKAPYTTLNSVDWNALTYAGHTVWNVHAETNPGGGYKGGRKRRPRSEWVINENTHEALITTEQAEAILHQMENSSHAEAVRRARNSTSDYLLSGLLVTPDGDPWYGNAGKHYRTKRRGKPNKWISKAEIEGAVTAQIILDMKSDRFAKALVNEARALLVEPANDPATELRQQVTQLDTQISRALDLALELDDRAPAIRRVNELEARRKILATEIEQIETEQAARRAVAGISLDQIRRLLRELTDDLSDRQGLKEMIGKFVERVVLDPLSEECSVHYRFAVVDRTDLASPRGSRDYPAIRSQRNVKLLTG